jgi:hypothetical protein
MRFGDNANRRADRWRELFSASALDPDDWRPDIPAILAGGRAAARRRRVLTTAAAVCGAAVVGTGAAAIPALLPDGSGPQVAADTPASSQPAPSESASAATTPAPETPASTWREVLEPIEPTDALERCHATLAEERDDVDPGSWEFDNPMPEIDLPQEYYVGDQIWLTSGDAYADCIVPGSWNPGEPIDPEQPAPDPDDHAGILAACSATISTDLREWDVRAADSDGVGGLAAVLTSPDPDPYVAFCHLQPASWQGGIEPGTRVLRAERLAGLQAYAEDAPIQWQVGLEAYHSCIKADPMPCHGGIYAGAGVVSPDIATLEFTLQSDGTDTIPVTDGLFAFRAVDGVTDRGLGAVWVSAYDAEGEVLGRFDAMSPGG